MQPKYQENELSQYLIDQSRRIEDSMSLGSYDHSFATQERNRLREDQEILESKYNAKMAAQLCNKQKSR